MFVLMPDRLTGESQITGDLSVSVTNGENMPHLFNLGLCVLSLLLYLSFLLPVVSFYIIINTRNMMSAFMKSSKRLSK
jgi:hypothetical protein